ncbi:hypothetical protein K438DRAFT_1787738 [Mycena galopus ATCC 62051]|nr:hypothetical protein K438DRAFT_1787738 [Mycena galopus ATCC 62051]
MAVVSGPQPLLNAERFFGKHSEQTDMKCRCQMVIWLGNCRRTHRAPTSLSHGTYWAKIWRFDRGQTTTHALAAETGMGMRCSFGMQIMKQLEIYVILLSRMDVHRSKAQCLLCLDDLENGGGNLVKAMELWLGSLAP